MNHFINIEDVTIPTTRQRREHDPAKHQELIASIQNGPVGLQNPIVVRQEGDGYALVSGERRLRAVREIYELGGSFKYFSLLQQTWIPVEEGKIPCTFLGELDELSRLEAEYDENERRANLTWQERAAATAALEHIRREQSYRDGVLAPSTSTLAQEIRGSSLGNALDATRKELILARHLDDPDVAKAKSLEDAYKMVKRKEETRRNAELAASSGKVYATESHKVYNVNCVEWMREQFHAQFDIICTDPPYGMGADEFGDSGHTSFKEHSYVDSYENWRELTPRLISGLSNLAKPSAHLYMFCDFDRFHELKTIVEGEGWRVFRTPMIWFKPSAYRTPWVKQGPQRKYECILYAMRGEKNCAVLGGDVLEFAPDENIGHEAQKPIALMQELLRRSASPGDRVFDPCAGSGPIFPAAHALKLVAVGCEIDPAHYGKCVERITNLKGAL